MDRLGRSIKHLIELVNHFNELGIGFKSLQENIDTTTSSGKLIFHIFASLAEFERDLISERTQAGLKSARSRGRLGGRPKSMDDTKLKLAVEMMKDVSIPVKKVCDTLNVSKSTLYRYLRTKEAKILKEKKDPKEIKLNLHLRVERNSKFVRGMKKSRKEIERYCLAQYDPAQEDPYSWEYTLTIPYTTEKELDDIIYEIYDEMESIADSNHCWTEASIGTLDGEKSW